MVDYLAQSLILPNVDLVVSHGGAGTTLGALAYGLPHLVMPGPAPSQHPRRRHEAVRRVLAGAYLTELGADPGPTTEAERTEATAWADGLGGRAARDRSTMTVSRRSTPTPGKGSADRSADMATVDR